MTTSRGIVEDGAPAVPARPGLRAQLGRLWRRLRGGELSRGRTAASVAVGLFIGSLPLYGLHLPLCLAVCVPLRLDAVVAYVAANISNPFVAPFLVTAEVEVGSLVLTGHGAAFSVEQARHTGLGGFVLQAAVGSPIVGALLAALGVLFVLLVARRPEAGAGDVEQAVERTVRRYRGAPRGVRFYVSAKLRTDPVLRALAALPGSFGRVLDAGAGRGQLGLALFELGRAEALSGFDWDARKVALAEAAGGGDAHFEQADLRTADFPGSDTVLLVDVLHYLSRADQKAVLERAARALSPGGRLVVREVAGGAKSGLTRLFERIGTRLRVNRGEKLEFLPLEEIVAALEALGLDCSVEDASQGTPLSNAMIVARRGE